MAKTTLSKICLLLIVIFGIASFVAVEKVHAQVVAPVSCTSLSSNLFMGEFDFETSNNSVTALQTFLYNQGYLQHVPTGFYGLLTYRAVANFQAAHGISSTGFTGPLTRNQIYMMTCGDPGPISSPAPVIYSINPTAGPAGTVVTITGRNFDSQNTINFDGSAIATVSQNVYPSCANGIGCVGSQTLTFTIPQSIAPYCAPGMMCAMYMRLVTPGVYPISVSDQYGTSNSVNFTVTSASTNPLSLSGIDSPNSLPVGTTGTWTVHVLANNSTNLHYSVTWGDEAQYGYQIMAPSSTTVQSSGTFTHAYLRTGTYTPTFIVSDDAGHMVTTSASVIVTPIY